MKKTKSPRFDEIRRFYRSHLWSESRLKDAVSKGVITEEEFNQIVNKSRRIIFNRPL